MNIPTTQNPNFGFYGTLATHTAPDDLWKKTVPALSLLSHESAETVACFLDSRHGRHFADEIMMGLHDGLNETDALQAAINRWLNWQIGQALAKETGLPADMPYLVGLIWLAGVY